MSVDARGIIRHHARSALADLLRPGDLVIANDAATLPASLGGRHAATGSRIEVRLAGHASPDRIRRFVAVVFGEGNYRIRTEDRPAPPLLEGGDRLYLGPLRASVVRLLNHPRLIELEIEGTPAQIWEGLARHGRPIQYAHVAVPLVLWDTWTAIAGVPIAFEAPSAGFVLSWEVLASLREVGVRFATLTHAAGISSTGDATLDALLPLDEPYRIAPATALAIDRARKRSERIVAIGTTVVRALEHSAAMFDGAVPPGERVATGKLGASSELRVVDAILSGAHEAGTSHHRLLRAFVDAKTLERVDREFVASDYRTHEFGDSIFIDRNHPPRRARASLGPCPRQTRVDDAGSLAA
jgi:S-adenosylmethionine:tRNA ribosyltransferase-isomerase